jgi:hypothetical protein
MSPWRGRYGALPATGLIVALFLLQLPTPQLPAGSRDHHSVAGTGNGSNRQPRAAATQVPAPSAPPAADTAASAQTAGRAAVANPPARLAAVQSEDLSATEETVLAGAGLTPGSDALPSAGAEPEASSRRSVSDNTGAIDTRPGGSADDMAAAQYQDISRNKPAGSGRKIAGAGAADLSTPRADPGEPPGASSTYIAAQRLPASYINRFSLQQRSQITAYFARLEDTP